MTKPILTERKYNCPECGTKDTLTLSTEEAIPGGWISHGQAVMWCANGHVTVFDEGNILPVYDFTGERDPDTGIRSCSGEDSCDRI